MSPICSDVVQFLTEGLGNVPTLVVGLPLSLSVVFVEREDEVVSDWTEEDFYSCTVRSVNVSWIGHYVRLKIGRHGGVLTP